MLCMVNDLWTSDASSLLLAAVVGLPQTPPYVQIPPIRLVKVEHQKWSLQRERALPWDQHAAHE